MAESEHTDPEGQSGFLDYLRAQQAAGAEQDDPIALMRAVEKALVERIADVDDDRRRIAIQMQKSQQAHRDELERAMRQQRRGLLTVIGLLAFALAGALGLLLMQMSADRDALTARIAAAQSRIDTAQTDAALSEMRTQLDAVGGRVDGVSAVIDSLREEQQALAERASGPPDSTAVVDADGLAARLRPIEDAQARLTSMLQRVGADVASSVAAGTDLRERLERLESASRAPAPVPAVAPAAEAVVPAPDAVPEQDLVGIDADIAPRIDIAPPPLAADPASAEPADAAQPAGSRRFAVQLASVRRKDALIEFARRQDLSPGAYILEEDHAGGPLYSLIGSLHPDYAGAEAAIEDLPKGLARDVWVRELSDAVNLEPIPPR